MVGKICEPWKKPPASRTSHGQRSVMSAPAVRTSKVGLKKPNAKPAPSPPTRTTSKLTDEVPPALPKKEIKKPKIESKLRPKSTQSAGIPTPTKLRPASLG